MSEQKVLPLPAGGDIWYHFATQVSGDIRAKRYIFSERIIKPLKDALYPDESDIEILKQTNPDRLAIEQEKHQQVLRLIDQAASVELNAFAKILAQTELWQHLIDDARKDPESLADNRLLTELESIVHRYLNSPLGSMEDSVVREGVFDFAKDAFTQNLIKGQAWDRSRAWEYQWETAVAQVAKRLGIDTVYGAYHVKEKFQFDFYDDPTPEDKYRYRRLQTAFSLAQIIRFFQGKSVIVGRYIGPKFAGSAKEIRATKTYSRDEQFINTSVFIRALEAMDQFAPRRLSEIDHAHTTFTSKIFEGFEDSDTEDLELLLTSSLNTGYRDDASYALGRALKIIVSNQNIAEYIVCASQIPQYAQSLAVGAITAYRLFYERGDPRAEAVKKLIVIRHRDYLRKHEKDLYSSAFEGEDTQKYRKKLIELSARLLVEHTKQHLRKRIYVAQIREFGAENTLMALKHSQTRDQFTDQVKYMMLKTLYSIGVSYVIEGQLNTKKSLAQLQTDLRKMFTGFSDIDILSESPLNYRPPHKKTSDIFHQSEFIVQYMKLLCKQNISIYGQDTYREKATEFFESAHNVGITKEQLTALTAYVADCFAAYAEYCDTDDFAPQLKINDAFSSASPGQPDPNAKSAVDDITRPMLAALKGQADARFPRLDRD